MNFPETINPWLGIAGVLGALGLLLCALRVCGSRLSPEVSRKTAHVFMGLICLGLPRIFRETWPVTLLAVFAAVGLGAMRAVPFLKKNAGGVLHGVGRASFGEIYFPVAVAAVFFLSAGKPNRELLFCVPVLMLTFADAAGALVGTSYGRMRYVSPDGGGKSHEGSAAFFCVAFLCVHVPVLLFSDVGRVESLLVGVLLAGLLMLAEAASWRGLDNLFIPLAGYVLLKEYLQFDACELGRRTLMLAGVLSLALWLRRRLTVNGGTFATAVILCYACGAFGGVNWLIAPLAVFIGYTIPFSKKRRARPANHNIDGVLCVATGTLFWAFAGSEATRPDLIFPFTVWLSANLAIIIVAQNAFDFPKRGALRLIAGASGFSVILCMLPLALLNDPARAWIWVFAGIGSLLTPAAAGLFYVLEPNPREARMTFPRWILQGGIAALLSFLAWLALSIPLFLS